MEYLRLKALADRSKPEPSVQDDLVDALEELATWLRLNKGPKSEQVMQARAIIAAIKPDVVPK